MEPSLRLITYSVTKETSTQIQNIGVIPCFLLNHQGLKLEFNNNTTLRKSTNSWKLNSQLVNHPWVKEEIKKEIEFFEMDEGQI